MFFWERVLCKDDELELACMEIIEIVLVVFFSITRPDQLEISELHRN